MGPIGSNFIYIWGKLGLVASNVILWSSDALAILLNYDFHNAASSSLLIFFNETFLQQLPVKSPRKSDFLEFRNLKLKKNLKDWDLTLWSVRIENVDILEMANRGAKKSEIWYWGALVQHIWGMFDLIVFKVILGYWVHLSQNGV